MTPGGWGILPETLGKGVWTTSQNPYPIYDQNLQFSLPYLWPDQKFDTLNINIICVQRAFVAGLV